MTRVGIVVSGAVCSLALCLSQSVALVVQRRAADRARSSSGHESSALLVAGLVALFVSGLAERVVQVTLLPLVMVVVMQNSYLFVNPLVATFGLGSAYCKALQLASAGFVVSGVALSTLAVKEHGVLTHTTEQLLRLFQRTAIKVWVVSTFAFVAVVLLFNAVLERRQQGGAAVGAKAGTANGICCGLASGFISGHMLLWLKCVTMILERAVFVDRDFMRVVFHWQFTLLFGSVVVLVALYFVAFMYALKFWSPFVLKSFTTAAVSFTALVDAVLMFHDVDRMLFLKMFPFMFIFSISVFMLSYTEQNHTLMADEENPLEPNRTKALSYASLRPLSMYSSTSLTHDRSTDSRQSIIVDETTDDSNYVSFHRSSESEYNGNGSNKKRPLSFEQEELLANLA